MRNGACRAQRSRADHGSKPDDNFSSDEVGPAELHHQWRRRASSRCRRARCVFAATDAEQPKSDATHVAVLGAQLDAERRQNALLERTCEDLRRRLDEADAERRNVQTQLSAQLADRRDPSNRASDSSKPAISADAVLAGCAASISSSYAGWYPRRSFSRRRTAPRLRWGRDGSNGVCLRQNPREWHAPFVNRLARRRIRVTRPRQSPTIFRRRSCKSQATRGRWHPPT